MKQFWAIAASLWVTGLVPIREFSIGVFSVYCYPPPLARAQSTLHHAIKNYFGRLADLLKCRLRRGNLALLRLVEESPSGTIRSFAAEPCGSLNWKAQRMTPLRHPQE